MKITLNRVNDNFLFELKNERGHIVNIDARPEFGGNDMGPSPMELVLMGVAGCSGIRYDFDSKKTAPGNHFFQS